MSTPVPVGFSQRLQLDWLEHTATLVLAGHTRDHIVTALQELLRYELSVGGTAPRGNREKAITVLLQIWVAMPRHLRPFRDEGLAHMQRLPVDDRIAVHWGMAMAVYPFFGAVAAAVGRLVRLQGTCAVAHVQRRVREQLGERETVARAVRRTLRCFVDWGILLETEERGVYQAASARPVQDTQLVVWLTEAALLTSRVHTGVLTTLAQAPALFPFHLASLYAVDLAGHSRLEPSCHGLNEDIVRFREHGRLLCQPGQAKWPWRPRSRDSETQSRQ